MTVDREEQVKSYEEIVHILEAFDLTNSYRDAYLREIPHLLGLVSLHADVHSG